MEDGKKYEGRWKNGQMHGLGKLFDKNGKILKYGIWEKGKLKSSLKQKKWEEMKA